MFCRFSKRLSALIVALILLAACALPVSAASKKATVYIRGRQVSFSPAACMVGDETYVPLREFAEALDPRVEISWNEERQRATVTMSGLTLEVTQGWSFIVANGHYLYLGGRVRNWEGSLMLPVSPLADGFGVEIDWDEETNTVSVTGEVKPISYAYYDDYTLYWLSHIIHAEAGVESMEGKIAVGNVVMNRVHNAYWSSDIYDVIFDNSCGVQFSPTEDGSIYQDPSEESIAAAKMVLDGADVAGNSLFFVNPDIGYTGWFERNCELVAVIGNHDFYTAEYYFDGF